jgi:hypothetical protein
LGSHRRRGVAADEATVTAAEARVTGGQSVRYTTSRQPLARLAFVSALVQADVYRGRWLSPSLQQVAKSISYSSGKIQ